MYIKKGAKILLLFNLKYSIIKFNKLDILDLDLSNNQ